jgi:hypothetical protein
MRECEKTMKIANEKKESKKEIIRERANTPSKPQKDPTPNKHSQLKHKSKFEINNPIFLNSLFFRLKIANSMTIIKQTD